MKKLFPLLTFLLFIASCYTPYYYIGYSEHLEKPLFTKVPMKSHDKSVEIFFPGEKPPGEEYIKVDILEVVGGGRMKDLIKNLQEKGRLHGVDALMIMGNDTYEESVGDYVYTNQKISALGIKYIKNIDYLNDCIKQANVISLNEKTMKYDTTTVIRTDAQGRFLEFEEGEVFYWGFLYYFSLEHLAYDYSSQWQHKKFMKDNGLVRITRVRTHHSNPGVHLETVIIEQFGKFIRKLKVNHLQRPQFSAKISFNYDKDGYLIEKDIDSERRGKFKQKFVYDENGLLLRIDVFKIKDKKEEFYFKAVFERYEQDDLVELIKAER